MVHWDCCTLHALLGMGRTAEERLKIPGWRDLTLRSRCPYRVGQCIWSLKTLLGSWEKHAGCRQYADGSCPTVAGVWTLDTLTAEEDMPK